MTKDWVEALIKYHQELEELARKKLPEWLDLQEDKTPPYEFNHLEINTEGTPVTLDFEGEHGHCNNCMEHVYTNMPLEFLYDSERIIKETLGKRQKDKAEKEELSKIQKEKDIITAREREHKRYLQLKKKFEIND